MRTAPDTRALSSRRRLGVLVAIRLGLLWQAAFSIAMLRHYADHGSSMYLPNVAGAWPYVYQHGLWVLAFVCLALGRRGMTLVVGAMATFLAGVGVVSLAVGGGDVYEVLGALGYVAVGVFPLLALLALGREVVVRPRLDWLVVLAMTGTFMATLSDGVSTGSVVSTGPARSAGVLLALRWGWVASVVALIVHGRRDLSSQVAALAGAGHLLVVEIVWYAAARSLWSGLPDGMPTPPFWTASARPVVVAGLLLLGLVSWLLAGRPARGKA